MEYKQLTIFDAIAQAQEAEMIARQKELRALWRIARQSASPPGQKATLQAAFCRQDAIMERYEKAKELLNG